MVNHITQGIDSLLNSKDHLMVNGADVFRHLTDSLKTSQVTEVDFSSCGIGPVALGHLSDWVREATAVIASLDCSQNGAITGKRSKHNNGKAPWIYGEKTEGWVALCSALPDTMISLDFKRKSSLPTYFINH